MSEADRTNENWTTVTVTALPAGWRNVYTHKDGTVTAWACPALLLQEHRSDEHCRDVILGEGKFDVRTRVEHLDPPYDTRVVFASDDSGWLEPAMDSSNYAGTVGPGADPDIFAATPSIGVAA